MKASKRGCFSFTAYAVELAIIVGVFAALRNVSEPFSGRSFVEIALPVLICYKTFVILLSAGLKWAELADD